MFPKTSLPAVFLVTVIVTGATTYALPAECRGYQTLSSADRSQKYIIADKNPSKLKCDDNLKRGWYRFIGAAGFAMPTSCTRPWACSTHASGWLQGSHPTVADGVVTRTVYYSWGNSGCHYINNDIRVRNCGEFYVYELRPRGCAHRYCGNGAVSNCPCRNGGTCRINESGGHCTCLPGYSGTRCETATCSGSNHHCQNGGTCTIINGGHNCTCRVGFSGKYCESGYGTNITCEKDYMEIKMDRDVFGKNAPQDYHLKNKTCRATLKGNTLSLRTPLDSCGTTHRKTAHTITYWNEVSTFYKEEDHRNGSTVIRSKNIHFPFYCKYGRRETVSTSYSHVGTYFATEGSFGNFTFTMQLFRNSSYSDPYRSREYPVSVAINEPLFVRYSVSSITADLLVFAENCRATTTRSMHTLPAYEFIKRGCAVDNTMTYNYRPGRVQQFTIMSFRFIANHPVVYLHCELLVCHKNSNSSRCRQGCVKSPVRSRRDAIDQSLLYDLSTGPVVRKTQTDHGKGKRLGDGGEPDKLNPVLVGVGATFGGLFILVSIAFLVVLRKKKNSRMRSEEPADVPVKMDAVTSHHQEGVADDE